MAVATWITSQLVFNGLIAGLEIGLLAMGIVLIYRSTRVINFAVGNMGLVGASLLALLVIEYDIPFWLAAIGSLIVGTLFGAIMELVVIRRLFYAPRVVVLVSTIGISGLAVAIVTAYPEITDFGATYPPAVDNTWSDVLGVRVTGAQLAVLVVVPVVALALGWFLNRTLVGRTVKASAENPDLARVQGINPKLVSTAVWSIAGFLATLTMVLVAADNGGAARDLLTLGPNTLVRALAAAVIAGMVSFPRAMLAGVAIGVVQALVNFNYLDKPGLIDGLLFVAVLIAVALQSRTRGPAETQTFSFAPKVREIPEQLRDVWWVKRLNAIVLGTLLLFAILLPLLITQPSRHLLYATIACFAICGLSLIVLTGWAGQLSLGQMAFAGFGALVAAALTRGMNLDLGVLHLDLAPLPFLLSIVIAALASAGARGADRRRRSARARPAPRGQHVRLLGRRVAVPVPPAGAVQRSHDGSVPARVVVRPRPVVAAVVLLRVPRRARGGLRRGQSAASIGNRAHHHRGARQRRPRRGVHRRRRIVEVAARSRSRDSSPGSVGPSSPERWSRCRSPSATSW